MLSLLCLLLLLAPIPLHHLLVEAIVLAAKDKQDSYLPFYTFSVWETTKELFGLAPVNKSARQLVKVKRPTIQLFLSTYQNLKEVVEIDRL
jgi:hypothetical protein